MKIVMDEKIAQLFELSSGWEEREKIKSIINHINSMMMPDFCPEFTTQLCYAQESHSLVVKIKVDSEWCEAYENNFRQTYAKGWGTGFSQEDLHAAICYCILKSSSRLDHRWKQYLDLSQTYKRELKHKLPPGTYEGRDGFLEEDYGPCPNIEMTPSWECTLIYSKWVFFPPEGWSGVTLRSHLEIAAEKEAQEEATLSYNLAEAQRYVGWTVKEVKQGVFIITNGSETATISHTHDVWDYGDASQSWLTIEGKRI